MRRSILMGRSNSVHLLLNEVTSALTRLGCQDQCACIPVRLSILKGRLYGVQSIAFSPDVSRITSGSDDDIVRIRNVKHPSRAIQVMYRRPLFSPDGNHFTLGRGDKTVRIWDTKTKSGQVRARIWLPTSGFDFCHSSNRCSVVIDRYYHSFEIPGATGS